jgi:hypothetical protein
MMLVMLLWVFIHTGQAWKICLTTVGIEPTTFGILAQCNLIISIIIYLIKKFLVSDWVTANCEIVISTQWLTKNGFFTFILAKWRQRVNMKKNWTRLRHITNTMTTRIILTRWRHWYDAMTAAEGLRNCFFLYNTNKIQMFVLNFLNK